MGNLYDKPIILAPSSFSDHNVVLFEPAPSLKFDAGKTVSINIRVSSERARDLSNCLLYQHGYINQIRDLINFINNIPVIRDEIPRKPWITRKYVFIVSLCMTKLCR